MRRRAFLALASAWPASFAFSPPRACAQAAPSGPALRTLGAMVAAGGGPSSFPTPAPTLPPGVAIAPERAPTFENGGPHSFDAVRLIGSLFGDRTDREIATLAATFGAAAVERFFDAFTFAVNDALDRITQSYVVPAVAPSPEASPPVSLAQSLEVLGSAPGRPFDSGRFFRTLFGGTIAGIVEGDVRARFGAGSVERLYAVLGRAISDLRTGA